VLKVVVEVKGHMIRALSFWRENRFFSRANGSIATKQTHDVPQMGLHPGCAQGQGRGPASRDTGTYMISQKSLILPGKRLNPDQIQSFPNHPFPLSVRFSSASQTANGCEFAL